MPRLKDKIALVTGGSSGIGLATARRFAEEGAFVYITGRRQAELDKAAASIERNAKAIRADSANDADLDRLYAQIEAEKGKLDVLVANAGVLENQQLGDVTAESFEKSFGVNVRGTLFTVQKAIPLMRKGGSVVLLGSIAASMGFPAHGAYSATKAAVRSFARTWTAEFKSRGIRVNTLSPGPIDTPMFDASASADKMREKFSTLIPLERIGRPEEIANAALFLASDESSFVAGIELVVDGGMSAV
jgi:NAD(P)-dependent dehydrogenase (short-subunit alcohol dehydrogenase family)